MNKKLEKIVKKSKLKESDADELDHIIRIGIRRRYGRRNN